MVRLRQFAVLMWGALVLGVSPGTAHADAAADAKAHFKKGTTLYRQAQYPEAIQEFQEAYRVKPSGVLYFNIGLCYEKLGDTANAMFSYHRYLTDAPDAGDHADVEASLANLEKRLAGEGRHAVYVLTEPPGAAVLIDGQLRGVTPVAVALAAGHHDLQLAVTGMTAVHRSLDVALGPATELRVDVQKEGTEAPAAASSGMGQLDLTSVPGGAAVAIDGKPTGATPLKQRLPVGEHQLDLSLDGYLPLSKTVTLTPDQNLQLALELTAAPKSTPVAEASGRTRIWTWVAAGVAVAALGTGIGFGLAAQNNSNTLHHPPATLPANTTRGAYNQNLVNQIGSQALTANILYGGAGVAAVASIGLFFLEPRF